ncbi:glutathione S-transferase N-terminal domain-containing protein [bacterium]|nr:glutathione S-transferase N-terminal domain-containing protein [bacterium]
MIELYISNTCPYCRKVMDFFNENNIIYTAKEVSEPDNLNKLLEIGGMHQVPFMIDGEKSMYESDDIINYTKEHYVL